VLKYGLVFLVVVATARLCEGQATEPRAYGQLLSEKTAPPCEACRANCSPSRFSTLTVRAVGAPQPAEADATLAKIVSVLENHQRDIAALQQRINTLDRKLDTLLQDLPHGYPAPAGQPLYPAQPAAVVYVVPAYGYEAPADYLRAQRAQGSAVYGSPVYASYRYLDYGAPLSQTPRYR
jgi:hypothetical protein